MCLLLDTELTGGTTRPPALIFKTAHTFDKFVSFSPYMLTSVSDENFIKSQDYPPKSPR